MMHLLRKYDVAPFGRNDAMFAPMCPQAHIKPQERCTLARDAIRLRRLHTRLREITYQSFGLDRKKTVRKRSFFLAPPVWANDVALRQVGRG